MEIIEEISKNSKRKMDEPIENDSPDKKFCSESNVQLKCLNGFNNNSEELDVNNCINSTTKCENDLEKCKTELEKSETEVEKGETDLEKCDNDLEKNEDNDITDVLKALDSKSDQAKTCVANAENEKIKHDNELVDVHEQNEDIINAVLPVKTNENSNEVQCDTVQGIGDQLSNSDLTQDQQRNTDSTSASNEDNAIASNINMQTVRREKCKYGSRCYRLNAEHKATFSHVGDDDYDIPDNRPECPYGLNCYRKNPLHKQNYKHTRSKRQAVINAVRNVAHDDWDSDESIQESVDESDYDQSFIDDDESLEEFESDFED